MFWFDKRNPAVVFMDNRAMEQTLCDGRKLEIKPDLVADFRHIPYPDNSFYLAVFDPPHLVRAGKKSWLAAKYGKLGPNWRADFLKDLKNTEKQKPLRCFANLFYYVAPAGLIQTEDLPPWAGLKELRFDEDKQEFYLSETQTPPYMANLPPTWGFVAECIRNRSEFSIKRLTLENERLSLEIIRLEEKLRDLEFENFLLKNKKKETGNDNK